MTLTAQGESGALVSGTPLAKGQSVQLEVNWPESFVGNVQEVGIAGQRVEVIMEKIADIP